MKLEMNDLEQMEQLNEVQRAQQMEMEPPKLEKADTSEQGAQNMETPPKLEREQKLGGTVMEMQLEMRKLEHEQLKKQMFGQGGKLGETREEFNRRRSMEQADNKIQLNNRTDAYEKAQEEAARKKEEYRNRLYGEK